MGENLTPNKEIGDLSRNEEIDSTPNGEIGEHLIPNGEIGDLTPSLEILGPN